MRYWRPQSADRPSFPPYVMLLLDIDLLFARARAPGRVFVGPGSGGSKLGPVGLGCCGAHDKQRAVLPTAWHGSSFPTHARPAGTPPGWGTA